MEKGKVAQGCLISVIILIGLIIGLSSCFGGEDKTFDFTIEEFEAALKQELNDTKGNSIIDMKKARLYKDGLYAIEIANGGINVLVYVDKNNNVTEVRTGAHTNAFLVQTKEVRIAFQSTLKAVDPSLSVTQQQHILKKLGISWNIDMLLGDTKSFAFNDVMHSYSGDMEKRILILHAKPM